MTQPMIILEPEIICLKIQQKKLLDSYNAYLNDVAQAYAALKIFQAIVMFWCISSSLCIRSELTEVKAANSNNKINVETSRAVLQL